MSETFDEYGDTAGAIRVYFEAFLRGLEKTHQIHFKDPYHDMARRLLNEIVEFKPQVEPEP